MYSYELEVGWGEMYILTRLGGLHRGALIICMSVHWEMNKKRKMCTACINIRIYQMFHRSRCEGEK